MSVPAPNTNPVVPYLSVRGGLEALTFYKRAFGAEEAERYEFEGKLGHAALRINGGAIFLADERLTANRVAGVLLGVAGVSVIIGIDALTAFDPRSLGQLAVLGAALSYAFAGVWAKKRMQGLTAAVSAAGMLTGSAVIMGALALGVEGAPDLSLTWTTVGALAYSATFGTVIAYLLYYRILATAGSGNLLLVTIMMPPISILLGALVLGERLAPTTYLGCGLIALGLVVLDGRVLARLGKRMRGA